MEDADLFGVQNPEGGEVGYCCVMGRLGEHFALAAYRGSRGLDGLWEMRLGPEPETLAPVEILATQDCLMASFEDRTLLQAPDRDIIKALGLKFRGRSAWPLFRSYLPGYAPWFLTGAEARFLTVALEQALNVAVRFREDRALLPETQPDSKYLVRVPSPGDDGAWQWRDARRVPAPLPAGPKVARPDTKRIQWCREKLHQTQGIMEMDFFATSAGIRGEDAGRPYFPFLILVADPESGQILASDIVEPSKIASAVPATMLATFERLGMLPAAIVVQSDDTYEYLAPTAVGLRIKLTLVESLRAVNKAREELSAFMGL